jgi:Phage gp6-like head-tail connector protein
MASRLLIPPAVEPVTLAEAKAHIPITAPDQDERIQLAISSARSTVEAYTERALITSTWRLNATITEREWTLGYIELAPSPVQSISSVVAIGEPIPIGTSRVVSRSIRTAAGAAVGLARALAPPIPKIRQLDITEYTADLDVDPARLYLEGLGSDRVAVTFVAGYGADGAAVPAALRQVLLQLIGSFYEHREDIETVPTRIEALPGGHLAREQLNPWRVYTLT